MKKLQDFQKYLDYVDKEAKKFRLTSQDLHNLYDLLHMVDTPVEVHQDIKGTLILNNIYEWVIELRQRIEKIVINNSRKNKNDKL